tara:strand:+ start:311 stop:499 length:189 start_codon:yes stop_codon:yes gene_type:complete
MSWHIKKTSMIGGDTYYKGDNRWSQNFDDRKTYTSQAKAKADTPYIWTKKTDSGWDVTAVKE